MIPARCAASTFSLMPPTGKHLAAQGDLSGHGHVLSDRVTSSGAEMTEVNMVTPADGPSLRHRSLRHMHMQIVLLVEISSSIPYSAAMERI